jgi:DNA-binding transcriptional LysR family regulator
VDVEPFTIAFVTGVTLTKWTGAWHERHPRIPLAFVPTDADAQVAVLHRRDADVSFVRLPIAREGLSVIPLYSEAPVVVLPKDHPLADASGITLEDLAADDRVGDSLSAADAVELVAAGGGIVLLPQSIARANTRKDVVARPVVDAAETHIALAWLADRTTPEIEEFVGIVRGRTANSSRSPQEPVVAPKLPQKPATRKLKPITGRTRPRKPRR